MNKYNEAVEAFQNTLELLDLNKIWNEYDN
jgi:hypothetical protein